MKVTIIGGGGRVGSCAAFALQCAGLVSEIQLLDANDQARFFKDGSPSAGRDSTDSWQRGEIIGSTHRLEMPGELPPGVYRLTVGIHPFGRKNWLPIAEENMPIALGDPHLRAHRYDRWIVVEQDVLPSMGTPAASAQRNRRFLKGLGL